ncbi:MAG: lysylphosphatidylglycerol synthase domain-containing protein, partial [Bdellovibrionota bacterium]
MKQKLSLILSSIVAIALMVMLFRRVDINTFWSTIQSFLSGGKIAGLLICSYLYVAIQGLRFSILYPGHASLAQQVGLNFGNHTGNILVPGRMGEAIRPLYLKRWWPQTKIKDVITWTVFEKFAELGSMVLFVATGIVVWGTHP